MTHFDKDQPPGGPRRPAPLLNAPGVVTGLMLALGVIYVLLWTLPPDALRRFEIVAALTPRRFLMGPEGPGGIGGMLAPLFGHMLIHATFMHLVLNSVWLLAFGTPVARRLAAGRSTGGGALAFLLLFALSGVAGALFYIAFHAQSTIALVGSSGGVSGLLGGLLRFALRTPGEAQADPFGLASVLSGPVLMWSAVIIGLNLVVGLAGPLFGAPGNIAWEAHIGGYLFGLLAFPWFDRVSALSRLGERP